MIGNWLPSITLERKARKNNMYQLYIPFNEIDMGDNAESFKEFLYNEIIVDEIYEKFHRVRDGDIVLDIGANVGVFPLSIHDRRPELVICMEPSKSIFPSLLNNLSKLPFPTMPINCGIGAKNEIRHVTHFLPEIGEKAEWVYGETTGDSYEVKSLSEILNALSLDRIDFLKIDCEGGEYELFNEENFEFITKRVGYIAGEWHLSRITNCVENFVRFRDTYLRHFKTFRVFEPWHKNGEFCWGSPSGYKDVTQEVMLDDYPFNYANYWGPNGDAQLIIYIDNLEHAYRS